ncbi:hypothetical protein [Streptomyces sp. NPDC051173]|uniref:hypothetical protein n=1 Tax=Streptomyces sp. NPDC051173 TaxID=3155164 RepID=UPI00344F3037
MMDTVPVLAAALRKPAPQPQAIGPVRVEPNRVRFGDSERQRRRVRKWPWAWWCTACDDAYGAGRTEQDAKQAARQHLETSHPDHEEEGA